jgi:hypothetical protein
MFRFVVIGILAILTLKVHGQILNVTLSPNHQKKLAAYKSGHKRLKQYYKFYKKDSAQQSKKLDKKYKRELDSAYRANRKQEKLERQLAKRGIILPKKEMSYGDSLTRVLKKYWAITKDSTASDSAKQMANGMIKEIALKQAEQYPEYLGALKRYQSGDTLSWELLASKIPGFDTLSGVFNSSPQEVFAMAEKTAETMLSKAAGAGALGQQFAEAEKLKQLPEQYMNEYRKYSDPEMLETEAKQKAADEAVRVFEEKADIGGAQKRISTLMSKYREFSGAADLSDAVRHTSLKGTSLRERLVIGGHFSVVSTKPASIDFSPQLGYKFNTRFFMGAGMSYRCTFGDSIRNSYYVSPSNTSYKAFISYDVVKAFYAFGEWEKSGISRSSNDKMSKQWKDNYFIGVGKRVLVLSRLYFTMTVLYNLNSEHQNPVHPNRFQVRTGFQLSERAMAKKKPYYDPNRH